ncbi:ABC transporter permease [Fodinicurvata sp. EGI_FJ10296]|uniref:ABC transporter permease n=1 Tax=Fodinicurvata sp. EGI_FJ10296 TaxID=3231908 RepID=UPI00345165CE
MRAGEQSAAKPGAAGYVAMLVPVAALAVFFLVPFGIMIAVSFYERIPDGFYEPGFELTHYRRFLSDLFLRVLVFSVGVSAVSAAICVIVGVPLAYAIATLRRPMQTAWLVFIVAILSLSEVIIGFSWSMLLSRTAGISNLFVSAGILDAPVAYSPGLLALLSGMVFLALPYSVLVLYPAVSRLDPMAAEAARTLGATPARAFLTVTVPSLRGAILATAIMVFVFTLGVYLLPQLLGQPSHWTLSVLITDQAIFQSNLPFAAALAVFLMLVSLTLIAVTLMIGQVRRREAVS